MVDIWGVGFTILTIVSLKSVDGSEIQLATAIVAAILVIAAVYVNPITRAKEYLYAWRKYKPQSFKIISNVTKFQNDHDKLELIVKESIKLSRDIEADFRSEEE